MVVLINTTINRVNNDNNNVFNDSHVHLLHKVADGRVTEPYVWEDLQSAIRNALISSISRVDSDGSIRRQNEDYHRCMSLLDRLQNPPFTIQRVCELLLMGPTENQQYLRIADYLRAMVNLLSVETACSDPTLIGRQ